MEIEAKIENPAIKKRLNDLDSDNPRMIKEAVNYLARAISGRWKISKK